MKAVPLALPDVRSSRLLELHYQAMLFGWSAALHTERSWSTDDGIATDESATFERVTGGTPITLYVFALCAGQPDESIGGVARIGDRAPVVTRMWSSYEPIAVALHDMALTS